MNKVEEKIKSLSPWFHNIHLPDGTETAPDHFLGDFPSFKWKEFNTLLPENLSGCKALDIGCNAGFYSFELAKRGAEVLGIDLDPHYLKQAEWLAKEFNLNNKVEFRQMQVYDLINLSEKFDIIIFMGVFYHLRYPLLALDIISQKVKNILVFQTLTMPGKQEVIYIEDMEINKRDEMLKESWPKMAFIESKLNGDFTNWWAPNHAAIIAMLRTCGLKVTANPSHEIYICQLDKSLTQVAATWNKSEFLSAIGWDWKKEVKKKIGKK